MINIHLLIRLTDYEWIILINIRYVNQYGKHCLSKYGGGKIYQLTYVLFACKNLPPDFGISEYQFDWLYELSVNSIMHMI